jgi:hypothetical protein
MTSNVDTWINAVSPAQLVKEMILFVGIGIALSTELITDSIAQKETAIELITKHLEDIQEYDIEKSLIANSGDYIAVFVPMILKDGSIVEAVFEFAWTPEKCWKFYNLRWTYETKYDSTFNVWLFEEEDD